MAEQELRIGFVGAGNIVRQRHMPRLQKLAGLEFAAVANRRPESTAAFAEDYGIRRTFEDWRDLVAWDGIDVVWCGTYPNTHRAVTEAALAAGKHVFCQARMAPTYEDAKAMYLAAQRSDRTTTLCPPSGYVRGDATVRRLLREGFVGQPYSVVVQSYNNRYLPAEAPLHWRQSAEISGYNALDLGILIEIQQRWLGYARRATALTRTFITQRPASDFGPGPVERPDALAAVVELENGALATFLHSGVAHHAEGSNAFEIFGSEGTIRYLAEGDRILAGRAGEALREVPLEPAEGGPGEIEANFIAAVRAGRRSARPSFWDGLKYMELTEAIGRSAEEGRTIELPFDPDPPKPPAE
jgi:predicted dehydrogenase